MDRDGLTRTITTRLQQVVDPCCRERDISVIDMGLLHDLSIDDHGHVRVEIILTSGWCPFQVDLLSEIEAAVADVPDVASVDVSISLAQAWSTERLSPDAAAKLQFLPSPSEVADRSSWNRRSLPVAPTRPETPAAS